MSKKQFLRDYIKVINLQAKALVDALEEVEKHLPLSADKFKRINKIDKAFFDSLAARFSKLQDMIGNKIFKFILEFEKEDAQSLRDKLNILEKLGYIDDVHWWDELRDIRNKLAHDYPDDYDLLADDFTVMAGRARELLRFWEELKTKLAKFSS